MGYDTHFPFQQLHHTAHAQPPPRIALRAQHGHFHHPQRLLLIVHLGTHFVVDESLVHELHHILTRIRSHLHPLPQCPPISHSPPTQELQQHNPVAADITLLRDGPLR